MKDQMIKHKSTKISANEINRFIYCPYQWYYNRSYGSKVLREKYKVLDIKTSEHESNFVKGQKFHHSYYTQYRLKRILQVLLLVAIGSLFIWWRTK